MKQFNVIDPQQSGAIIGGVAPTKGFKQDPNDEKLKDWLKELIGQPKDPFSLIKVILW